MAQSGGGEMTAPTEETAVLAELKALKHQVERDAEHQPSVRHLLRRGAGAARRARRAAGDQKRRRHVANDGRAPTTLRNGQIPMSTTLILRYNDGSQNPPRLRVQHSLWSLIGLPMNATP